MEIILLKDMDNLGPADTIVSVKPGYARNYLIPQGMAIVANTPNKNILAHRIRITEAKEAKMLTEFKALAEILESKTLPIAAKAGTSGKIFGSVTSVQIAAAIREGHGIEVERKKISIPEEVKQVGMYVAHIQLSKQVLASLPFEVIAVE